MPPREKEFAALCLVLDVGVTCHTSDFLLTSIRCASELLQRRLFSESTDRFGLVLIGDGRTHNALNYAHVNVMDGGLRVANWDLLDYVENHIQGTNHESDWLDGVIVALDLLKRETEGQTKCQEKKIILLSDLGCASSSDSWDSVLLALKKEKVELSFFGPTWAEDDPSQSGANGQDSEARADSSSSPHDPPKTKTPYQKANEAILSNLVNESEGVQCSIEDAMATFINHERRKKKPFPWKVAMEIGPNISINTVGYIQTRREPPKSWKKCLANPPANADVDELKAATTFVKNNDAQEVVEGDNLIESYKYGPELITVADEDKAAFSYDGGPKSLCVLGFVPQDDIQRQWLLGDGSMVFQPVEDDEPSTAALSALAFAMHDMRMAAIVRKVYRAKATPRMGLLVPEYRSNDEGVDELTIVFIELPYAEDLRQYEFAPVFNDSIRPSSSQLEAMDDYIDNMMLIEDGEDLLKTETIMNPCNQYLYRCLTHRVTQPGKILPDVPPRIKEFMKPPRELAQKMDIFVKRLQELFPCEEIDRKKEKITGDQMFAEKSNGDVTDISEAAPTTSDLSISHGSVLVEVGTTTPVEDFQKLLDSGSDLVSLAQQLESVIEKLVHASLFKQLYGKICDCLKVYRASCLLKDNPHLYNDYLNELKHLVESKQKTDLLKDVQEKSLGLIGRDEHHGSKYSAEEALAFLATPVDATEASTSKTTPMDEDEEEDMLDDL
uniref:Ku80 n=1 Tax=Tigriopus japonicus TaxID=158387 RepID=A0A088DJX1_TIGJA|nr:Ku80 [Tigriopus japonicus]